MNKRRRFKAKRRRSLQKLCRRHGWGWPIYRAVLKVDRATGAMEWL